MPPTILNPEDDRSPEEQIEAFVRNRVGHELNTPWNERLLKEMGTGLCMRCTKPVDDHAGAKVC